MNPNFELRYLEIIVAHDQAIEKLKKMYAQTYRDIIRDEEERLMRKGLTREEAQDAAIKNMAVHEKELEDMLAAAIEDIQAKRGSSLDRLQAEFPDTE